MKLLETIGVDYAADPKSEVFEALYKRAFPIVARFAARLNGSLDDAKDIFHDALVIYYEKSTCEGFVAKQSPEAYIAGIARHLWIRKFKHDRNKVSLADLDPSISIPADYYPSVNESRLLRFIEQSGKKCLELLQKFYYGHRSMQEVATVLGYPNAHAAAAQKYKCIGRMREALKSKSVDYEDFLL